MNPRSKSVCIFPAAWDAFGTAVMHEFWAPKPTLQLAMNGHGNYFFVTIISNPDSFNPFKSDLPNIFLFIIPAQAFGFHCSSGRCKYKPFSQYYSFQAYSRVPRFTVVGRSCRLGHLSLLVADHPALGLAGYSSQTIPVHLSSSVL